MTRDAKSSVRRAVVLLALALFVLWPLLVLGLIVPARTSILAAFAAALGAALALWLEQRRPRIPDFRLLRRVWFWAAAALVVAIAIGVAKPGVRMVFGATVDGLILGSTVAALRERSR